MKHYRVFIVTGVIWLILDEITKAWAKSPSFRPLVFIKDFFYLALHQNTGIAFGIPLPSWLQILTSIILITALLMILIKSKKTFFNQLLFGIIIGGAVGNFISRMMSGSVTDFIALKPFPAFNLADVGISIGLVILFITTLQSNNK
ncbi:MAG: signal peptidase II [Candidatus Peregrinibacteria bacterium]